MNLKTEAVCKVTFLDGGHKWYRISKDRNLNHLAHSFMKIRSFRYAKVYAYNRKTKVTGEQIAYFGINTKTGEVYLKLS